MFHWQIQSGFGKKKPCSNLYQSIDGVYAWPLIGGARALTLWYSHLSLTNSNQISVWGFFFFRHIQNSIQCATLPVMLVGWFCLFAKMVGHQLIQTLVPNTQRCRWVIIGIFQWQVVIQKFSIHTHHRNQRDQYRENVVDTAWHVELRLHSKQMTNWSWILKKKYTTSLQSDSWQT